MADETKQDGLEEIEVPITINIGNLCKGAIIDDERRAYIESHVGAVADAIDQGVDVRGYFLWSLLDNFEWASGYTKRFGIYYVDYATQARTLKASGFWFKNLANAFHRERIGTP